jgi:hypothetical protein
MLLIKVKIQISPATLCDLYARDDTGIIAFVLERSDPAFPYTNKNLNYASYKDLPRLFPVYFLDFFLNI